MAGPLGKNVLVNIVRDALNAELPEPLERVLERERRQRRAVEKLLIGTVADRLKSKGTR